MAAGRRDGQTFAIITIARLDFHRRTELAINISVHGAGGHVAFSGDVFQAGNAVVAGSRQVATPAVGQQDECLARRKCETEVTGVRRRREFRPDQ